MPQTGREVGVAVGVGREAASVVAVSAGVDDGVGVGGNAVTGAVGVGVEAAAAVVDAMVGGSVGVAADC